MNFTNEKLVFHRTRDVGEVISTTFRIIRENAKSLLLGIIYFAGPFYVVGGALLFLGFKDIMLYSVTPAFARDTSGTGSIIMALFGAFILMMGMVMQLTHVNELVKYIAQNPDRPKPTVSDLWKIVRARFWPNILNSIMWIFYAALAYGISMIAVIVVIPVVVLLTVMGGVLGAILMVIVYLLVYAFILGYAYSITVPVFFVSTYENGNLFRGIERTFSFMHMRKQNFWGAIFANLLAILIRTVASSSFLIPVSVVLGVISYTTGNPALYWNQTGLRILTLCATFGSLALAIFTVNIPLIAVAVKYFDWVERLDGKGLMDRIQSIGTNKDFDVRSYEESY